jgi:hypothetical protein
LAASPTALRSTVRRRCRSWIPRSTRRPRTRGRPRRRELLLPTRDWVSAESPSWFRSTARRGPRRSRPRRQCRQRPRSRRRRTTSRPRGGVGRCLDGPPGAVPPLGKGYVRARVGECVAHGDAGRGRRAIHGVKRAACRSCGVGRGLCAPPGPVPPLSQGHRASEALGVVTDSGARGRAGAGDPDELASGRPWIRARNDRPSRARSCWRRCQRGANASRAARSSHFPHGRSGGLGGGERTRGGQPSAPSSQGEYGHRREVFRHG